MIPMSAFIVHDLKAATRLILNIKKEN
jgi:hypothetical protein